MAVVKMSKFTAIGLDSVAEDLMTDLMELGVAELSNQDAKLVDETWSSIASKGKSKAEVSELENKLNATDTALKTLETYDTAKKPLFSTRRAITEHTLLDSVKERDVSEADANAINAISARLRDIKTAQNKNNTLIASLGFWVDYTEPLEITETEYTYVNLGFVSGDTDIDRMRSSLEDSTELLVFSLARSEREQQYVSLIYHKESEEKIIEALKPFGWNKLHFKDIIGTASENIDRLKAENDALDAEVHEIERGLAAMAAGKERLELYYDSLDIEKERAAAFGNMLVAGRAFYIDGWVQTHESENLTALLTKYDCHFEINEPEADDEPPVLLANSKFIEPVEVVTGLYSLPNYREPDPTPVYALFYICFFGIMFADMGYGFILAALSYVLVRSGKLEGTVRKFIKQLGYCGVSTFIWGALFGSFFGDIITVTGAAFFGQTVGITPLWFNPIENPMMMLAFACAFGVVHIFVALGVKAYIFIKRGKVLQAINDALLWYVLIIGLALLIFGEMAFDGASDIGQYMAVISAIGIVILPAFYEKGAAKALGLWKLYGIVNYLADVLSYARLLALCLAGAVIAQVFNMLAGMAAGGFVGTIAFVAIILAAHVFNFLMSGLGCFVHSIRLQYVEFFGKFFEGNGEPFRPFARNTKYVKIVKEEN